MTNCTGETNMPNYANTVAAQQAAGMANPTYAASAGQPINEQQAFVYDAFRGQPYIVDQLDIQDEPIYDRVSYSAGGTVNTLTSQWFTNVGVQANPAKGLADTNVNQPQQLPVPEAMAVFGIRLCPSENVLAADWENMLNTQVFQMFLNQKPYNTANIRHYAAGMGTYAVTTRSAESWYTNGFPSLTSGHQLQLPLVITNLLRFYGQLVANNPLVLSASGTGLLFLCELVGLHARAVQ